MTPTIGSPAPQFEAPSTAGVIKLVDCRGSWVVLFSYAADFTAVCSSELDAFADRFDDFESRQVRPIGVSADSIYAHTVWAHAYEGRKGRLFPFPLVSDAGVGPGTSGTVGAMYGFAADRCTFIIDPNQEVRAVLRYPLAVGRSVDEILRVVDALQVVDERKLATPANWRPGDAYLPSLRSAPSAVANYLASISVAKQG